MIPVLESAPESDFGSFWTSDYDDSGSSAGIGSTGGIEHCWSLLQPAELPVISYFNAQNGSFFQNLINIV